MNGWRLIEDAPLDGTKLLLGWWRTWPKTLWETEVAPAGNVDIAIRGTGYLHGFATHWMPLPGPPTMVIEQDTIETPGGNLPYGGASDMQTV